MERWASNTLRVLGIVVTVIVLVFGSLLLLLLSLCSWSGGFEGGGGHTDQAIGYLVGLIAFLAATIFVIAKLARGIAHSTGVAVTAGPVEDGATQGEILLHISPASEKAIHRLIYAIVVSIVVSAFHSAVNILWTSFRPVFGLPGMMIFFSAYQAPYAVLLVNLRRKPDRRVFAYALAIPLVTVVLSLYNLPLVVQFARHSPVQLVFSLLTLGIDCLILWLAWKASQRVGYQANASSLLIAGAVMLFYFGSLRYFIVPVLLRLWR